MTKNRKIHWIDLLETVACTLFFFVKNSYTKIYENPTSRFLADKGKGKGKMHPCTGTEALYRPYGHRGSRGIVLHFHDHGTRRGWGVSVTPRRERPGSHCTGGWVSPRAGLDRCGQSRPPPGFDPRTLQPIASRYTDYVTRSRLILGSKRMAVVAAYRLHYVPPS